MKLYFPGIYDKANIILCKNTENKGVFLVMSAAMLWGTAGISLGEVSINSNSNASSLAFFRLFFSLPILFIYARIATGKWIIKVNSSTFLLIFVFGIMNAFYQIFTVVAISMAGVTISVLVTMCSGPLIVAIMSLFLIKEKITIKLIISLSSSIFGIILLVWTPSPKFGDFYVLISGIFFAFLAAISYATCLIAGRMLSSRCNPLHSASLGFSMGTILLLFVSIYNNLIFSFSLENWFIIIYIGVVPTAIAYVLFLTGLKSSGATTASVAALVEPLTSTILSMIFLGERLYNLGYIGAFFLIFALFLLSWRPNQPA
jgi:DME family drug/metabolite transporter